MNSPENHRYQALKLNDNERTRIEFERQNNILRLMIHNNRRIRAGLAPLAIPERLLGGLASWVKPINRDPGTRLTTR